MSRDDTNTHVSRAPPGTCLILGVWPRACLGVTSWDPPVCSVILVKGPLQSLFQGFCQILLCFSSLGFWEVWGALSQDL